MKEKSISSEVRNVLADAMCLGRHSDNCQRGVWNDINRSLPARHPAREFAPQCDCWKSRAAELINLPNS